MRYMESSSEFAEWIRTAEPGSSVCYATSQCLARDPTYCGLASEAMRAWYLGTVDLVQRRITPRAIDPGTFDYIAIKRRHAEFRPRPERHDGYHHLHSPR